MAEGCLERGEAGGECDVEEWSGREGEEGVVGLDEEGCQVLPAGGRVEGLEYVLALGPEKEFKSSRIVVVPCTAPLAYLAEMPVDLLL